MSYESESSLVKSKRYKFHATLICGWHSRFEKCQRQSVESLKVSRALLNWKVSKPKELISSREGFISKPRSIFDRFKQYL